MSERILNEPTNDTGAYNLFWSYYDEPYPNDRTSLIVYPKNGRIPPTLNGVITQLSPPGSNPATMEMLSSLIDPSVFLGVEFHVIDQKTSDWLLDV